MFSRKLVLHIMHRTSNFISDRILCLPVGLLSLKSEQIKHQKQIQAHPRSLHAGRKEQKWTL